MRYHFTARNSQGGFAMLWAIGVAGIVMTLTWVSTNRVTHLQDNQSVYEKLLEKNENAGEKHWFFDRMDCISLIAEANLANLQPGKFVPVWPQIKPEEDNQSYYKNYWEDVFIHHAGSTVTLETGQLAKVRVRFDMRRMENGRRQHDYTMQKRFSNNTPWVNHLRFTCPCHRGDNKCLL